ncbi:EF-Tu/IF-2/RF-3 family GTPase [Streptomyces platensis]|uniref:EF-Tu/IF-2/RF-3 family GTPase n=1 Tax=Streptomyces platensis TaxID=58346 RepID=UPI00386B5910|nr:EF-Tu/IF-2/RF-3 family GTPase [Streptomyces platensis]
MNIAEAPFLLVVEDFFPLNQGRLVRVTGRMERGRVRTADEVQIVGFGAGAITRVSRIDGGRQRVDEAYTGMNVGLLLPGAMTEVIERGQVLAAPGSIGAHIDFDADIVLLPEDQGGSELRTGGSLDFYIHAGAVRGTVTLPHGMHTLHPLHTATATVTLERPVALERGRSFAFRHHGRAGGSGTVTRLLD